MNTPIKHQGILFDTLKNRWLPYWINARTEAILVGTNEQPMDFEAWWQNLPNFEMKLNFGEIEVLKQNK